MLKSFNIGIIQLLFVNSYSVKLDKCSERDLNLGPKRLSLLEFETWRLRPLGHHGRFSTFPILK